MYLDYTYNTNRRLGKIDKKTKAAPAAGRRRKHGQGRYLQGREGRARWGTSSNQRTERWTSSRSRAFAAQNLAKSDFSIARTTWATLSSMYLLSSHGCLLYTTVAVLVSQHDWLLTGIGQTLFAAILYRQSGNAQRGLSLGGILLRVVHVELTTMLVDRHTAAVHRW